MAKIVYPLSHGQRAFVHCAADSDRPNLCIVQGVPAGATHNGRTALRQMPGERKRHRVYMSFMFRNGCLCQFLEEDLKTSLPRKVILGSQEKVREMARRGGAAMSLDVLQALDHGIEIGRGGIWLELSGEQYQKFQIR
jgi:hypothetical protein